MSAPSTSKPAPELPEIPGYRVEAVIGRGSAGTVYRAVQLAIGRKVALKVLHAAVAARGRAVRRLQREARTTAKLSHPGIVTAIDMGSTNGLWWYAMELVEGPSLAEKLKRDGALEERDALKLFIPLCEALEHAFDQGVVHRDIKPGNILIDGSGRARIVDLGLAFAEDDPALTQQGGTLGTPHYISPEQARNPKNADVRSDIWSLGATLYHCVCGRPPFHGTSVAEILSGVLYSPVPDPARFAPELSRALRLVLRKCLAREPDRRYQHPRELREDLEAIRERRSVSVKRSTLEPLLGEREAHRRALWSAGAVLALVLVVAFAAWRPWASAPREIEEPGGAAAVFEPLENIAREARHEDARLGRLVAQLQSIAPSIPARFQTRADEVRADLDARYSEGVVLVRSRFESELGRLWHQERDFVGALRWIDSGLNELLGTRLGTNAEQTADLRLRFGVEARRLEVEQALDDALFELYEHVRRYYQEVHVTARATPAREAGKWRSARAALDTTGRELIAESRLATEGFPAERVEVVAKNLEANVVKPAVAALEQQWSTADRTRSVVIARAGDELERELEDRKIVEATRELERRWSELVDYAPGEDLDSVSRAGLQEYESARDDLARIEARIRAEDGRLLFANAARELEPAWRARKFDQVIAKLEELAAWPALESVRPDVDLLLREAHVLEDVLQRAALRLEQLSASRAEIELYVGGLLRRGRVEEGYQPFLTGFRFRPSDAAGAPTLQLALRELPGKPATVVSIAAIEQLARLTGELDPDRRFESILLRWHEGEINQPVEELRKSLEQPTRVEWVPLVVELRRRLDLLDEAAATQRGEREKNARALLRLLHGAESQPSVTPRQQAEWIDELLKRDPDLDVVRNEADWLHRRRAKLRELVEIDDEAALRKIYGPSELSMLDADGVSMRYVFDASYEGPFARGDWNAEPDGWIAPGLRDREQLKSDRDWPTLFLRERLDLDEALDFELVIEPPLGSGRGGLVSLSVAGVHVVFLGPRLTGEKGRVRAGSGSPEDYAELLRELIDDGKGSEFEPFVKDRRYTIRVELRQGRGDVRVLVDGKRVLSATPRKPDASTVGDELISIRTSEPVRVVEARLRAKHH